MSLEFVTVIWVDGEDISLDLDFLPEALRILSESSSFVTTLVLEMYTSTKYLVSFKNLTNSNT